jgi:DNA-binding NtrC family response regulator
MSLTVLICDDDDELRAGIVAYLTRQGYRTKEIDDGAQLVTTVERTQPDVVVLDLHMPQMSGLEALRRLRLQNSAVPVIVMTAFASIESAIEATRLGASQYITKPFSFDHLTALLGRVAHEARTESELSTLKAERQKGYARLVGDSAVMQQVFRQLRKLEDISPQTALITGEAGTGHDLVAQTLHQNGPRRNHLLLEVDASEPEATLDVALFGQEGDNRTAKASRGLLELAGPGTVYIDDIAAMALPLQAKLVRVLEQRRFRRVGGTDEVSFQAAVVASAGPQLQEAVTAGRIREDLVARLGVVHVKLPPLRERIGDVALLVEHFRLRLSKDLGTESVRGFTTAALNALSVYRWPGNVRELRNIVERAMILSGPQGFIDADALPPDIRFAHLAVPARTTPSSMPRPVHVVAYRLPEEGVDLERLEHEYLVQALERSKDSHSRAAKLLGISRHALRYRAMKAGLSPRPGSED